MKDSARSGWCRGMVAAAASLVMMTASAAVPRAVHGQCTGDCSGDGHVTIDEILTMVNIALNTVEISACENGDADGSGTITIDEILTAVNIALLPACPTTGTGCGNGVVDAGEDCDTGGFCIGGTNAGTSCTADSQCVGDGVCDAGPKTNWACGSDADCPSGACVHCKTFGGSTIPGDPNNTCAANCTFESPVDMTLVPGQSPDGTSITPGTSGLAAYSGVGITVGIPFPEGTTRQLIIGKEKDGTVPVVLKEETNQTAAIDVLGGAACICLRAVPLSTCGGTLWEKDGVPSTDCTAGYTAGDSLCAGGKPCTSVYRSDNVGAGSIGCGAEGLVGVNTTATQDSGGSTGIAGPVMTSLTDTGPAGSAVIYLTTELGFIVGSGCTNGPPSTHGMDRTFCTDDDPQSSRGNLLPQVLTTGTATATIFNANLTDENTVPDPPTSVQGTVASCDALASGDVGGGALAEAFPVLNAPTVMDIVANITQVACPPPGTADKPAGCP